MSQDKDEIVKMAIKAGLDQEFWLAESHPNYDNEMRMLTTFATLCRAPLVAENAALKEQLKALGVYNESTKVELARVQAVAEWQGSADGGKIWRRIDKPRGESIESRVAYLRNMTNSQGRPIYLIRALYTPPQPAAQEPTSAVPVVEMMVKALQSADVALCEVSPCMWKECHKTQVEELAYARPCVVAAIAAGQKYLKENGKCY